VPQAAFRPPDPPAPPPAPPVASPSLPKPRPTITSTSYGLVIVPPQAAGPRPAALELRDFDPVPIPDFRSFRRRAGHVLLAVLILGVAGAIVATILSYQLNV
jgi:hypothetical protein